MAGLTINQFDDNYAKLSSMKRIQSAKDDPAGAAIAEGMKAQATQSNVLADGAATKQDSLRTADGGLDRVASSLQRMRELSVQAGNATYTQSDKQTIQDEIDQLKQDITAAAKNTTFNTKKLLDGSEGSSGNATLDALGITDYSVVSGNFDISTIDKAIDTINDTRSGIGATSNTLDSTIAYHKLSNENLTASYSKIEDLDAEKAISDQKKEEVLNEYRTFAQQAQENQAQGMIKLLTQ